MKKSVTASVLGLALITGCATQGYQKAEKTSNSLDDVKSELLADKANLRKAVDDLNDLVYNPQSDLRPQFEKYSSDVDDLNKSAATSRASAANMTSNREAYLTKWKADIAAMTDTDLRMRAMDRIDAVEKTFATLSQTLTDTDRSLAPVVSDLNAQRRFLSNDLTAANIKMVSDRATDVKNRSIAVNQKIDAAVVEVDKVNASIAPMPATPSTQPGM